MNNQKGRIDAYVESYGFWLSNQHCLRGKEVYISLGIAEKRQESEIHNNAWVLQQLLTGNVPILGFHHTPLNGLVAFSLKGLL